MAIEGKKPSQLDDATVEALRDRLNLVPGGSGAGGYVAGNSSTAQKPSISTNQTITLPNDTALDWIYMEDTAGTPTVKVGTTIGGFDLVPEQLIAGFTPINLTGIKYPLVTTLYVTVSGGTINFRLDYRSSFWTSVVGPFDPSASYTKAQLDASLLLKADKANVLLLDGATPDLQPASKADIDIATGLVLLWYGSISATGTCATISGTLTVSAVHTGDGVYTVTHDHGDIKYVVIPGLGTNSGASNARTWTKVSGTSFIVRVSSDNVLHDAPFEILIYKYF